MRRQAALSYRSFPRIPGGQPKRGVLVRSAGSSAGGLVVEHFDGDRILRRLDHPPLLLLRVKIGNAFDGQLEVASVGFGGEGAVRQQDLPGAFEVSAGLACDTAHDTDDLTEWNWLGETAWSARS